MILISADVEVVEFGGYSDSDSVYFSIGFRFYS